jgi:alkylation response protein AidB-like acyl-CoA dehydrogenase
MDFSLPERVAPILTYIERFLRERVEPRERALLAARFTTIEPELAALRREVKEAGYFAPQAPKELGGVGLSLVEHGLVSEALGRSPFGHYLFGAQAPDAGNLEILAKFGTPEQKARWLMPLARGELRSCFAMTEPDRPGSNPTELGCLAKKEGDHYVLDGRKWFSSAADGAAFAIVMAVTDPAAPPHLRATMIIVPTDTPGFRRVRNIPIMGHAGEGWMSHAELALEGCRVPASHRLGDEGKGFAIAQERLGPGRIHHCMRWIGICERAFDLMCRRALARAIDAEGALARKQFVQGWIAESRARIDAARLAVLKAAWDIDHGGFKAAAEEISLIKFHVAGVMLEVVDRAIQVHGALGITDDTVLSYFYAHERGARIYDGPDEVHKLAAARRILSRYGG